MQLRLWPNKLGVDVRQGRLMLWVNELGNVQRCVPDDSLVGYCGTHYTSVPRGTWDEMAKAAVDAWKNSPHQWTPCE